MIAFYKSFIENLHYCLVKIMGRAIYQDFGRTTQRCAGRPDDKIIAAVRTKKLTVTGNDVGRFFVTGKV